MTVSCCLVSDSGSQFGGPQVIQDWPGENSTSQDFHGNTTDKVSTTMLYDIDGCRWGCQIQNKEQRYEWFKLGLDPFA